MASEVCGNLGRADLLLSNHCGHGHTFAKGTDPAAMMRELSGREGRVCGGKGGSMYIADFGVGLLGANEGGLISSSRPARRTGSSWSTRAPAATALWSASSATGR